MPQVHSVASNASQPLGDHATLSHIGTRTCKGTHKGIHREVTLIHKKTILPGLAQCAQSYHDKYGFKTDKMAFLPSQTLQHHSHTVYCSVHSYMFKLELVKSLKG